MAALLNWQQIIFHAESHSFLGSAHGDIPVVRANLTAKQATICAQLHPQTRARPRVQGYSVKDGLLLHSKGQ